MKGITLSVNTTLRYNEYYNMQETFDMLYERSKANATRGLNLYDIIISESNILLAYRNIKANTGSKTEGTDGLTIEDYKILDKDKFIQEIRKCLKSYKPNPVRRVEIPKPNGKKRPLGIPTMRDRLIQQMFKQVLEPICEAKFFNHSYGFRPNRSTHHAVSRFQILCNKNTLSHVVDIDIQGFFDNVNHSKLMKQIHSIGITDKRVLRIISLMLKAPIKGIGIPTKGTPQGGILSPLLSNIVLNEFDWWIATQWETFKTKHSYHESSRYRAMKQTKLKPMFLIRYADDFKIVTNSYNNARKIFHATKDYLKTRLKLDISEDKSSITNLRKNKTEFLGIEFKLVPKEKKFVINSNVTKKNKTKIKAKIREITKKIQINPTNYNIINEFNSYVLGIHNYYRIATHVSLDFHKIAYQTSRTLFNRLKNCGKFGIPINPSETYKKFYGRSKVKTFKFGNRYLYPIGFIQNVIAISFNQDICNYTPKGRTKLHAMLEKDIQHQIIKMVENSHYTESMEYYDNRISKYSMQKGKCAITGEFLTHDWVHCHHIIPRILGGDDNFNNLTIVNKFIHKLIHATEKQTIDKYLALFHFNGKQLKMLNNYRKKCNLFELV